MNDNDRRHYAHERAFWYAAGWIDGRQDWDYPRHMLEHFPGHYADKYVAEWNNRADPPYLPDIFKAWLTGHIDKGANDG